LPILLRSAASNETAAELMRQVFREQVVTMVQRLIPGEDAAERAALVSSLLLGVALSRYILKLPPLADLPAEQLVARVGGMIQRALPPPP
jgi:AcrR family transcriptional regulator